MSEKSVIQNQLKQLKTKLDASINARSQIEDDFNKRSILLTEFIAKLSRLCKGLDLELDNRLAKLRALLKKAAPLPDIEKEITNLSKLLNKQASKNENNIRNMHNEFHQAGAMLQKAKGLPPQARRELRSLLTENTESKDALIQYVPKLSELLSIYSEVVAAKDNIKVSGKDFAATNGNSAHTNNIDLASYINKFISILNGITLSDKQQQKLNKLKSDFANSSSMDETLLSKIVEVFNIVAADMEQERKTAKTFLSTLSGALSKVQRAVKSTITDSDEQKELHEKINQKLTIQIGEMTSVVESATSLTEAKAELNDKIEGIAQTVEAKSLNELEYFTSLEQQLKTMQLKVIELEKQSQTFEKRLIEQQQKSMLDALTKLNNRASFDEHIAKQMVRYHHKPFELAIAVLDIDDFKRINDTYGHTAGDKTLQVIASTLVKSLDDNVFIARYGGEEFVLVFDSLSYGDLMVALDSLRNNIAKLPFKFKNNKVSMTTSIGVTHIRKGDNIHKAFERADQALYQAKNKGKNQVIYSQ
ncbi:diguanylate cyclase [Thalassotalea sp. M1531]|uniref:diguanylate cyclase n=1 Tax=Thalassotalea algicola TaxID=2716224 RepID=A0A7Y0Q9K2_9GAMM|nr:GGDEF domain-containing protein [Thalassotalea algicola]NMP33290.1 diguanylate cyclase [Thalassotalea algicola]